MSLAFGIPCATLALGLAIASPTAPGAERQESRDTTRFHAMDRNHDGVVTRAEWRGSEQSFRVHDWNGDGVLSGDELVPGASRPGRPANEDDYRGPDTYPFSDWTEAGFRDLDRDRDGRLSRGEWSYDAETFTRMDANHDGVVILREFLETADDDREDRFDHLDVNGDGRVTRNEWQSGREAFDWLDRNGDGVVAREEFADRTPATGSPQSAASRAGYERGQVEGRQAGREDKTRDHWDLEGQGELEQADSGYTPQVGARSEYQAGYRAGFRLAYGDGFGRDTSSPDMQSPAYRAGVERGTSEGRQAGLEDKTRNHWDLEGQRELEQADSGYTLKVGSRSEYQAGYRAGFRRAYAEGFGPR